MNKENSQQPLLHNYNYCMLLEIEDKSEFNNNNLLQSQLSYAMQKNNLDGNRYEKLCFSAQQCQKIPETLVKLYGQKVQTLDLSYNELVTLRGLEGFPLLRVLVLDNNQLTDSMVLPYLPHLNTLSLNKNKICDIESLVMKIRQNLPSLTYLSLLGNKACPNKLSNVDNDDDDYQRYRYYVLYYLPDLKFLDSTKVRVPERNEARRRGNYMKIVRPVLTEEETPDLTEPTTHYTPLPKQARSPEDQKAAYGKCKYHYTGKRSEGNRFICNSDL